MDDFDSLWFFNNVLTLAMPPQHLLEEETKPSESIILHDALVCAEILVPRCPNCGGVEQWRPVQHAKPERRKRGRRRRKRSKRKLDLGYYGSLDSKPSFPEETNGPYYLEMPPLNLNDGFAMKEHLKSWAYAVASTVR